VANLAIWGMVHAEAMLGAVANAEHRFTDAAAALVRAAALSETLGFVGQAALHLTTLGRVQQRSGTPDQALDTLTRAIQAATTAGDRRIAATARIHLARGLRGAGDEATARSLLEENDRWYRASGGGDGALLTRGLLAALSVEADTEAAAQDLHSVLDEARHHHDLETQTLALDALARAAVTQGDPQRAAQLLQEADGLHAQVQHTLDDADRIDARTTRASLSAEPGTMHADSTSATS
jgi:ATP/maltotriose-dependent transcriptional regulator MalT